MSRHLTEKQAYNEPNICHYQMWKFKPNIENNIHNSVSHIAGYSKVNISGLQYLGGGEVGLCCILPFGHWEWGWRGCLIPPRDMVYASSCIMWFLVLRMSGRATRKVAVWASSVVCQQNLEATSARYLAKTLKKVTGTEILLNKSQRKSNLRSMNLYMDLNLFAQYRWSLYRKIYPKEGSQAVVPNIVFQPIKWY